MSNVVQFSTAYADEWLQRIVDGLGLGQTTKGEFHGACPNCGGDDRFFIKEHKGQVRLFCGIAGRSGCSDYAAIQAALRARGLWPELDSGPPKLPDPPVRAEELDEPYDIRKGIDLLNAKRENGVVIVPLYDVENNQVGRQRILKDGKKLFDKGFKKDGHFAVTKTFGSGPTYICEGYATGCSITMATDLPSIIALDAGNLPKVARAIQKRYPNIQLIGAGDNDEAGVKAMSEAMVPYSVPIYEKADWNDVHVRLGLDAVKTGLKTTSKPLFKRLGLQDPKPPVWLVQNHVEEGTFVMVFGASGAKKSFLVYDLACCIATGRQWHGYRVKQGAVLVIYGEGGGGIERRLRGWQIHNGESLETAPLYGNERPLILTDDKDIDALIAYIEHRISIDGAPALLVVDTLARALGSADEKSGADINKLIAALTEIIQKYRCAVALVHHTGHSESAQHRARGASELPAAVDHEFRVEPYNEAGVITGTLFTNTKNKDGQMVEPVVFDMVSVGLGICDEDAQEITTLVPELRGPARDYEEDLPDPLRVVIDEEYKLRRRDALTKRALIDAVRVELGCAKRTAERWVKRAIDEEKIDV